MSKQNSKMAVIVKGIVNQVDVTTPATDKLKVRAVRDFISNEEMNQSELRMNMDKMDPSARASLYVILTALENAVT
jgi:ABC-type sugar transport system ATPase subunit